MDRCALSGIRPERPTGAFDRLVLYLGHYDLRVYVTERSYVDVGAGSLSGIGRLTYLHETEGQEGSLGSIGRWCEFATTSEIMGRAEHDHHKPVNISFSGFRALADRELDVGMKPALPIRIGSGVALSSGSKVLSGVAVGDAAVLAAAAVATKDVEAFTIVAGAPARPIRKRGPFRPWWNLSADIIPGRLPEIEELALTSENWRRDRPRFVLRICAGKFTILGFLEGDAVADLSRAPPMVQSYLRQAFDPDPEARPYWLADCWPD